MAREDTRRLGSSKLFTESCRLNARESCLLSFQVHLLDHHFTEKSCVKRLAADAPLGPFIGNSFTAVAGEKKERYPTRVQYLRHRINLGAPNIHVEKRKTDVGMLCWAERAANTGKWPDHDTKLVLEKVLDQERDKHLIFNDENA